MRRQVVMLLCREVEIRSPSKLFSVVAIGVLSFFAAVALAIVFMAVVSGCAQHAFPPTLPTSSQPVCDAPRLMPAVACSGRKLWRYSGCHWRCRSWFEVPDQQEESGAIIVDGYVIEVKLLTCLTRRDPQP